MRLQHERTVFSCLRIIVSLGALLLGTFTLWLMNAASAAVTHTSEASLNVDEKAEKLEPSDVSLQKSRVYIFVDKSGFGHQHGVEGLLKSGKLTLGAIEDAGSFVFDMKSFDADTDAARRYLGLEGSTDVSTRRQVNDNMKAKSILNVAQFPTATFAIKSATLLEKRSPKEIPLYELAGEFTLRGKTRPLTIQAEAETKDNMVHVRGQFSILQTQYGITPFKKALGTIGVADQLTIHGDIWVAAEDAPAEN
jgi:polyisoprenoid-binding protein YceI